MLRRCALRLQGAAPKNGHYDYVIVGGGSAGCVLANRLSADPAVRVCLLEAGPPDNSRLIHAPGAFGFLMNSQKDGKMQIPKMLTGQQLNWAFESEPEPTCGGRRQYQPRGRTLGGTSSINATLYVRGNKYDYDSWEAMGNRDWGWEQCVAEFKNQEDSHRGAGPFHGSGGPLKVSNPFSDPTGAKPAIGYDMIAEFIEGCQNADIPETKDYNCGDTTGCFVYDFTARHGKRCSSAAAFLAPVRDRPNLEVRTNAHACRVVLEGKKATGVEYRHADDNGRVDGTEQTINAGHVIVSSGAFQSPQLLQLSGIGPRGVLEEVGIECKHHLPGVGANLLDHCDVTVADSLRKGCSKSYLSGVKPLQTWGEWKKWVQGYEDGDARKCIESQFGASGCPSGAFFKSTASAPAPDMQLHFIQMYYTNHMRDVHVTPGYLSHICLLYPKSKGSVTLKSKDPTVSPRIQMNWFTDQSDLDRLGAGLERVSDMMASSAFDQTRGSRIHPGEDVVKDKAKREEWIRNNAETLYHPTSSCRMGKDDDAVVSDRLRVHGLSGLSVVDASVMPNIVGGNTNAPTMMIAGRAAKWLIAGEE
eukprot:TRINITY_DN4030_c0_g1_i4.p1 TRINITY_DN4030_c0_g1~~TRINITY_DN4030_c0_g1_i4.p1  ORF type:complete len:587 (+),score=178.15 TRINITY_DN4030_c0_g1_i4:78-1838(+)